MSSIINVDGLRIEYSNGNLTVKGLGNKKSSIFSSSCKGDKDVIIDKDGNINGDVSGNIEITGDNVTLIIQGDVEGNIVGSAKITVKGDIEGNIVGGSITR